MATNWQTPGSAGTDQMWDYSGLSTTSVIGTGVVDPATTTNGAQFPSATHAVTQAGNVEYLEVTDEVLRRIGASSGQTVISSQDGEEMLRAPFSYGDNYTDEFAATFSVSGITYYRSGSVTVEADGTGSLEMPYGEVNNILRVKVTESYQDSFNFAGNPNLIHYESEIYIWYKPGVRAPVLAFSTLSTDNPPNTVSYGLFLEETAVSVAEVSNPDTQLEVFPNPAQGHCNIRFQLDSPQEVQIRLVDVLGREVRLLKAGQYAAGSHQESVSTSDIANGLYYLLLQSEGRQQRVALRLE
ncbi:MAG: T9SS type A sorting domain-containing protein, partial [Phaeodactylibacter sp.]|nr:T9SS type A sorting domain-containing protein [Phaeodactylibacter sp.]